MRNLTIKRTKSFVGCIIKMKVYIEDPASNEITINNVPCRKLGTLKNGETVTFQIDNNQAKIFVIADKISKEYCNDFYTIPEGEDDISISGKNHFNPSAGNAFLFDGIHNDEILEKRNKNKKKGLVIFIAAIFLGVIIGLLPNILLDPEPKTFTSEYGINITLTDEFKRRDYEGFTDVYTTSDIAVMILKEGFFEYGDISEYTISEYGYLFLSSNEMTSTRLSQTDNLTCFEYNNTSDSNKEYGYLGVIFKDDDAFWIVQFSTYAKDMDEYRAQFIEWAKTVKFN